MLAQPQIGSQNRQRLGIHQRSPEASELALLGQRQTAIQFLANDEAQHRIAQKFETFVVAARVATVRQRLRQQRGVRELVP